MGEQRIHPGKLSIKGDVIKTASSSNTKGCQGKKDGTVSANRNRNMYSNLLKILRREHIDVR